MTPDPFDCPNASAFEALRMNHAVGVLILFTALLVLALTAVLLIYGTKVVLKRTGFLPRRWPGECAYCGTHVGDQRQPCPNCGRGTDTAAG